MFKTKILTGSYRRLLKKLSKIAATPEKESLVIKNKEEIVMIQMLQLLGIVGDCFKANKDGHFVLQTERNLITRLGSELISLGRLF